MFSLVYYQDNTYGVLDEVTRKFHKLNKGSFDMLVDSANEEGVVVNGTVMLEDGAYTAAPVAYTNGYNIFNCLPYVVEKVVPSNLDANQGYSMYFRQLISYTESSNNTPDILATLGLFAYYSMRIQPDMRHEYTLINSIVDTLAIANSTVAKCLRTEPYPGDVMRKFSFVPKESFFGKLKAKVKSR